MSEPIGKPEVDSAFDAVGFETRAKVWTDWTLARAHLFLNKK